MGTEGGNKITRDTKGHIQSQKNRRDRINILKSRNVFQQHETKHKREIIISAILYMTGKIMTKS